MKTNRAAAAIMAVILFGVALLYGCAAGPTEMPRQSAEKAKKAIVVAPKEIVVAPIGSWRPSGGWGSLEHRYTRNARIDTTTGHPRFVVEDANSLHVWLRSDVRVPISSYPIAVLKYRARNIGQDWYCIWMDDGTGPYNGCEVFELADLTADGKTHECRFDLRKERLVHTGRTKKLNENGTIKGMALGVRSGEVTPAFVEIIDLRFLPTE